MADEETDGQERTESPPRAGASRRAEEGRVARSVRTYRGGRAARRRRLAGDDWAPQPLGVTRRASCASRPTGCSRRPDHHRLRCDDPPDHRGRFVLAALPFLLGLAGIVLFVNLVQARGVASLEADHAEVSAHRPDRRNEAHRERRGAVQSAQVVAKLAVLGLVDLDRDRCGAGPSSCRSATPARRHRVVLRVLLLRLAVLTGIGVPRASRRSTTASSAVQIREEPADDPAGGDPGAQGDRGRPDGEGPHPRAGAALARQRMLQAVPHRRRGRDQPDPRSPSR